MQAAGIDAARLASYDRPIVSEPRFAPEQAPGLARDLTAYLATLRARRGPPRRAGALSLGLAPARPCCRPRRSLMALYCTSAPYGVMLRESRDWAGRRRGSDAATYPSAHPPVQSGAAQGTAAAGRPRAGGALGRGPAVGGRERAGLPPGARQGPRARAGGAASARRRERPPARAAGRRAGAAGARAAPRRPAAVPLSKACRSAAGGTEIGLGH